VTALASWRGWVHAQIRDVLRYQAIIHGRDETEVSCVGRLLEFLRDCQSVRNTNVRRLATSTQPPPQLQEAKSM